MSPFLGGGGVGVVLAGLTKDLDGILVCSLAWWIEGDKPTTFPPPPPTKAGL